MRLKSTPAFSARALANGVAAACVASVMALSLSAAVSADVRALRRDANLLKQKLATMNKRSAAPSREPQRITVSEREVNAYLVYEAGGDLPIGVVEPMVSILGNNRVSGRAVVDLDRVRKEKKPTSWLDPVSYLTGRLPLTATGALTTRNGVGTFKFESANVAGVPVPKLFLQQVVSYYSRSPKRPSGLSLDDPFALPARIREIHVGRGEAIVVQQ